ncbi:transposase [Plakobranchus ocellatus]|uniref:Transposase n=1 Tax=Plakobranchus ocellatus TaxID=259542 RepID=A0AAV4CXG9_9GAST|nr:transposase [Plakobranchus ocellatus]
MTASEKFNYHFVPEKKKNSSIQWKTPSSPSPTKAKVTPSSGKVVNVVYLPSGKKIVTVITGDCFSRLLDEIASELVGNKREKLRNDALRLHDKPHALEHRAQQAAQTAEQCGFEILP